MTEDSLERVLRFTTSITFDLKAFYDDTHRAVTGAPVDPVLRNAEIVAKKASEKIWEYRIVVIPQVNEEDIKPLCQFLSSLSRDLPVCFLAFRPNYVLEEHGGPSRTLMRKCVELAMNAGLRNVTWSGVPNISGKSASVSEKIEQDYEKTGAKVAASYALYRGCGTHPRDCKPCQVNDKCPLKRHIPRRSC
jgi:pyruvate formate lyase activating enzyme